MGHERIRPPGAAEPDPAAILLAFGANVRSARMAAGMTQRQVAAAAGLSRTFVVAVEQGRQNPSLLAIWAISRAIGVQPRTLVPDASQVAQFDQLTP